MHGSVGWRLPGGARAGPQPHPRGPARRDGPARPPKPTKPARRDRPDVPTRPKPGRTNTTGPEPGVGDPNQAEPGAGPPRPGRNRGPEITRPGRGARSPAPRLGRVPRIGLFLNGASPPETGGCAPRRRQSASPHRARLARCTDRSAGASLAALGRGPNPTLGAQPDATARRDRRNLRSRPDATARMSQPGGPGHPYQAGHGGTERMTAGAGAARRPRERYLHHGRRRQVGARAPASRRHSASDSELSNKHRQRAEQQEGRSSEVPWWWGLWGWAGGCRP